MGSDALMAQVTERQFERVVELAVTLHDEAEGCAGAGCFHAACAMIGGALEAALLATAVALESELRADGHWPKHGGPLQWSLATLIAIAVNAGWLPRRFEDLDLVENPWEGDLGDVVAAIQEFRNLAVHPGRHVREHPHLAKLDEPAYTVTYGVLRAVFDQLYTVMGGAVADQIEEGRHRPRTPANPDRG